MVAVAVAVAVVVAVVVWLPFVGWVPVGLGVPIPVGLGVGVVVGLAVGLGVVGVVARSSLMAKTIIALYGPSGSGKTALIGTFARWIYAKTGKKTRYYVGDGGKETIADLISAGIVDVWDLTGERFPFEAVRCAAQGYWRVDAKLLPPRVIVHAQTCPKCKAVLSSPHEVQSVGKVCATCKIPATATTEVLPNPLNDWSQVGLAAYEGGTAFAEMFMDNMSDRSARGERMGEDVSVKLKDGELLIASSSRTSYGMAQRRIKDAVEESRAVPCDYVLWSFLEDRGTDDMTRAPVFGPALVGHAATADAPRWFGPTLSARCWNLGVKGKEFRLHLASYFTDDNPTTPHIVNTRIPPIALDGLPEYIVFKPDNPTLLGDVIGDIEARQARAAELSLKLRTATQQSTEPKSTGG